MGIFQNLLKKGKVQVCLVFELSLCGFLFQAQVVAGALVYIHQDSRQADPFKIGPVLSIEGLAARTDKGAGAVCLS